MQLASHYGSPGVSKKRSFLAKALSFPSWHASFLTLGAGLVLAVGFYHLRISTNTTKAIVIRLSPHYREIKLKKQ